MDASGAPELGVSIQRSTMDYIYVTRYDGRKPWCAHWSIRTTSLPARRCQAVELVGVKIPGRRGHTLMCRLHKALFEKTGKIRLRKEANKFYTTRPYRTRNPK